MKDCELEARWRDQQLEDNGLLDPGQPTETAHILYTRRMRAPFTALERQLIRSAVLVQTRRDHVG